MEKVHFFFKKYYIRFLSALLVFAIFLPRCVVNASAEDDVIVQLYPSWTTYGYADFGCCSFGYTPSSYMKSVPMNINLTGGQQYFPEFIQTSSPYISSYLSGKTVYLCWFFRTTGNIIDRSNISVLVQSTTTSTGGFNNGVSTVSHTLLGGQASSQYHKAGYNESYCTYIRFTVPSGSCAFRVTVSGYTWSANGTLVEVCYPVTYVAGWDVDIADALDNIFQELYSQGSDISDILSVLNTCYTQLVSINSNASNIKTTLTTIATRLSQLKTDTNSIKTDTHSIYEILSTIIDTEDIDDSTLAALQGVQQRIDGEAYWSDYNATAYNQLNLSNFSFSQGVLAGIQSVGGVFGWIWTALGEYTVIPVFILTLGVSLVVIGRISRSGGRKKGD